MSPSQAANFAGRYRTRNRTREGLTAIPVDNLLWRDPKVPLLRQDATVQLELLGPDDGAPTPPAGLPDRERLMRGRLERTIQDTLAGFRPQLNRVVRELETHLQAHDVRYPEHQVVDDMLAALEKKLRHFAHDAVAFKDWSSLRPGN